MVATTPFNAAQGSAGPADLVAEVEALGERLRLVRDRIGEVIFGQREVVEQALITLLSGGHALLIGVPGLAKTRLVETLGTILGLDDKRIQCTPDLMPADILGSEVLEESESGRRSFRFLPGPVFCQLLMADEINRASPRTQSALLQAMQEGRVSIAGQYHPLPQPFHVLATQNPLEQEGTYPLPEAQIDRFMLHVRVDYPSRDHERKIMERMSTQLLREGTGADEASQPLRARRVVTPTELMQARKIVSQVYVDEKIKDYIIDVVLTTRDPKRAKLNDLADMIAHGGSPRASIALNMAARAHAFLRHRGFVTPEDVKAVGPDVLRHRIIRTYEAEAEEISSEHIVRRIFEAVEVP